MKQGEKKRVFRKRKQKEDQKYSSITLDDFCNLIFENIMLIQFCGKKKKNLN